MLLQNAQMTRHARIAGRQDTLLVTALMSLFATCAMSLATWLGNAQKLTFLEIEAVVVVVEVVVMVVLEEEVVEVVMVVLEEVVVDTPWEGDIVMSFVGVVARWDI